jgi:uncharacterized RDD family membrane protein YckC
MTQTPPTPTGPGWYDDPQDPLQLRYFDGILWTAHTTPRRSPTADASTIGLATPGTIPGRAGNPAAWAGQGQPDTRGQQGPAPWQGAGMPPVGQGAYDRGWAVPRGDVLPDGQVLAEWWRRLLGRIIDVVITTVISLLIGFPWLTQAMSTMSDFFAQTVQAAESGGAAPSQAAFTDELLKVLLPITLITMVVSLVYEVVFLSTKGATPGKMVMGTVVRRVAAPGRLSVLTALRRQVISVATSLLSLVPFASFLGSGLSILDPAWLLWDPKRQCLHDKVADTVVVLRNPQG